MAAGEGGPRAQASRAMMKAAKAMETGRPARADVAPMAMKK